MTAALYLLGVGFGAGILVAAALVALDRYLKGGLDHAF
jgi:hypothetical protein